jgi:hypothetical protein
MPLTSHGVQHCRSFGEYSTVTQTNQQPTQKKINHLISLKKIKSLLAFTGVELG